MKGKKNLERAIILGLILSTGVYGSAWAKDLGTITDGSYNDKYDVSVNIIADDNSPAIKIDGKIVEIITDNPADGRISIVSDDNAIDVNNGKVILKAADENYISVNGQYGIVTTGDENSKVTLTAKNNTIISAGGSSSSAIKAGYDENDKSSIEIISTEGDIAITIGNKDNPFGNNNAIEAKGGNLSLNASEDIILNSYSNKSTDGSAVRIEHGGNAVLTAGNDVLIESVNTNSTSYGLYVGLLNNYVGKVEQSSLNINSANNISIVSSGSSAYGISSNLSKVELASGNDTIIDVMSKRPDNDNGLISSVGVYNNEGTIIINDQEQEKYGDINISVNSINTNALGIQSYMYGNSGSNTVLNGENISISSNAEWNRDDVSGITTFSATGIELNGIGDNKVEINANNDVNISAGIDNKTNTATYASGITATGNLSNVSINAGGSTAISANGNGEVNSYGIYGMNNSNIDINSYFNNTVNAGTYGIYTSNSNVTLTSNNGTNKVETSTTAIRGRNNSMVNLTANENQIIANTGVWGESSSQVNLTANDINNEITTTGFGIYADSASNVNLIANKGINSIDSGNSTAVYSSGENTIVDLTAKGNSVIADTGIWGLNNGKVSLDASTLTNEITADAYGIFADTKSDIDLNAGNSNNILAAKTTITDEDTGVSVDYGQQSAVYALSGSSVDLAAGEQNYLLGAVYANGTGTNVEVKGKDGSTATNVIRSHAAIANAGDIDTTTEGSEFKGKTFYSALYAEDGANIKLDGNNIIGTWADSEDDYMLERTVRAYNEGTIDITGAAQIGTDRYDSSPNSADVAIAAGTATKLTKDIVDNYDETDNPRATVTVNYDDFKDENGVSISKSNISGDILSAYAGQVDIATDNSEAGINIYGNLLAGNNGILSVDLGKGGTLIGRADDYGDAGYVGNIENEGDSNEHQNFYNPEFSSTIYSGGRVDLEMGAGSTWYVTGQSWITSINTEKAQGDTKDTRATIDLTTLYENDEADATTAHALTVYDFKGDADFKMNLSGDRANSDMLYMKHADGTYRINLVDAVTTDEINSDQNGNEFSGLRFATVGSDSNVNFVVGSYDNGGAFNVEYEVGTDEYGGAETAHENDVYNGDSLNSGKPGSDMVDGFFGSDGEPVSSDNNTESGISTMDLQAANNIMLMSEEAATLDETAAAANDAADYNATNHKIIARLGEEISDTGKTILNMSRANYSNAIYMDRLNKRLGEARYINSEEDEGMWVRIRHDRIGKDDAYRSQNTMYELGYDQKQECDNGERRVGMAIDYMHGDTGYDQIAGKGEIDRYGLWLYDTWMGDKGHYADYVAKWGHLSNDFEVYTMQNGDKVTGDYSNNVFSVSAEYGRKKDIGSDWYFEPQVQAQLARVTGADYTTNQGTKVSVDGINSLIGRAGFRLGKDFGEEKQSTVYIKADVLHEFLGDQDVRVLDKSSDNKWAGISYENEGTWYDVGFGFATQMSKNSYAFMDFEKSFGNDNDETYQINVGMQWSF